MTKDYFLEDVLDEVKELKAEIDRLETCLIYEEHRGSRVNTHADGCYEWGPGHYECALKRITQLESQCHIEKR